MKKKSIYGIIIVCMAGLMVACNGEKKVENNVSVPPTKTDIIEENLDDNTPKKVENEEKNSKQDVNVSEEEAVSYIVDNNFGGVKPNLSVNYIKDTKKYLIESKAENPGLTIWWEVDATNGKVYNMNGEEIGKVLIQK